MANRCCSGAGPGNVIDIMGQSAGIKWDNGKKNSYVLMSDLHPAPAQDEPPVEPELAAAEAATQPWPYPTAATAENREVHQWPPPLISSQRHLDPRKVAFKIANFKTFIVHVAEVELRCQPYRLLIDGHHNYAAAKALGVEPTWRGPTAKWERTQRSLPPEVFERMLINNLTDSDYYYVETGEVVTELLGVQRGIRQQSNSGGQSGPRSRSALQPRRRGDLQRLDRHHIHLEGQGTGERKEETEWHRVVFYNRLAEIAGEYLKKGRPVYVEGRLKTRKWQDKDTGRRQVHDRNRGRPDADAGRAREGDGPRPAAARRGAIRAGGRRLRRRYPFRSLCRWPCGAGAISLPTDRTERIRTWLAEAHPMVPHSPFHVTAIAILCEAFACEPDGLNADWRQAVWRAPSGGVEIPLYRPELATRDPGTLTALVLAAHDYGVRVELRTMRFDRLRVSLQPRPIRGSGGDPDRRHDSMATVLRGWHRINWPADLGRAATSRKTPT